MRPVRFSRAGSPEFTAVVVGAWALAQTLLLTVLLARANDLSPLGVGELALALGWIALFGNAVAAAVLGIVWIGVRRLAPCGWRTFLVAGLLAGHVSWSLLNRLTPAQMLLRPPVFVTVGGILQLLAVAAVGALLLVAGMVAPRRRGAALVAAVAAVAAIAAVLAWNRWDERRVRVYPSAAVLRAAEATAPAAASSDQARPSTAPGAAPRVVLVGLDGMGWSIAKPLLGAGLLPNLAALVRDGAVGVLDNGDESYSPPIWNAIFTGRRVANHGIRGFRRVVLPRSGDSLSDLVVLSPTLHTFHGIAHLFERTPTLGLWTMVRVGSRERRAKPLWEVAAEDGKRVIVVDPITSLPWPPMAGTMIAFADPFAPSFARPASVSRAWQAVRARYDEGRTPDRRAETDAQASFAADLLRSEPFDLAVVYDKWIDEVSHRSWDFFSEGPVTGARPEDLPEEEWEALVLARREAPAVAVYLQADDRIGRLRASSDADFVLVSDHGWNYNGYLHYGSPDGIVVFSGPSFRSGAALSPVRMEDVAPTVLTVLGLPLSRELDGRVVREALASPPASRWVDAYGPPAVAVESDLEGDPELPRLRALGYVP